MKIKISHEFMPLNLITLLLILVITLFPEFTTLRIILGLPFILFLPGYTFISALFPRKKDLDSIERIALSFGLSIAITPLIGLILNYTPWGIRLGPILYSLSLFIFITSIISWWRRNQYSEEERFSIELNLTQPILGGSLLDRVLSIILIIAIIGSVITLIYVIATPKVGERFTEFYILGPEGMAENYPQLLSLGEEGKVILGIVNREHELTSYQVEIKIGEGESKVVASVVLAHEQKFEDTIIFVPEKVGENQKVLFTLYKNRETEPDKEKITLHLWVDVRD
ncbi:MAG: hypothetical protein DDT23_00948 [candidate division WS2 bacterium]|nr:hypothetical protein [Candidatus Lithacetigena glycinireducens]